MKSLSLNVGSRVVPVWIGRGLGSSLASFMLARDPKPTRVLVVFDPAVERLAKSIAASIALPTALLTLPQGEKAKRLMTIEQLHAACAKLDTPPDRSSIVVAVGGGATGDVGALFACTYMRGIPVVHVPTTLLSMVDSSIGGKTAVNTLLGKNMFGTFWQPEAVFADFDALASLPKREYRAALAEVVKTASVLDAGLFEMLEKEAGVFGINPVAVRPRAAAYSQSAFDEDQREAGGNLMVAAGCVTLESMVEELVERCMTLKAQVVAGDEREAGPRMVLNFGHTLGHAIEQVSGYGILHGEAVAMGMVVACRVGEAMGVSSDGVTDRIVRLLGRLGLPTEIPASLNMDAMVEAALADKKSRGGSIRMVMCPAIGTHSIVELPSPLILKQAAIACVEKGAR